MHNMQQEIDALQKSYEELEGDISKQIQENKEKAIESAKIEMAVSNLYSRCNQVRPFKENRNVEKKNTPKLICRNPRRKIRLLKLLHKLW